MKTSNLKSEIFNLKSQILSALLSIFIAGSAHADPIKVCTTTTDLGSLVREVGGEDVEVVTFAKGAEDAHFVEARPSFIKELSRCDLFIQNGLELELGWVPPLLRNCRNAEVQVGGPGYLDASTAITPRDVPVGGVDRSMGDVHSRGNPHFLLDPINGLKVARLIRDKLSDLRPERAGVFHQRYELFQARLSAALVGDELARRYDVEKLMTLDEAGGLDGFLADQNPAQILGGWLGTLRPYRGTPIVGDHPLWGYFANRFGMEVVGHMEPKPGITPTTRHLKLLVETMKQREARLVVTSVYFDPRYTTFLVEDAGARPVVLAHQVGATPDAAGYIEMIGSNVDRLAVALKAGE